MDNKVTAIDRLAELMKEYDFPIEALKDVIGRISSWQGSTNDDPYLWQQVRYFEELIKQGMSIERARLLREIKELADRYGIDIYGGSYERRNVLKQKHKANQ